MTFKGLRFRIYSPIKMRRSLFLLPLQYVTVNYLSVSLKFGIYLVTDVYVQFLYLQNFILNSELKRTGRAIMYFYIRFIACPITVVIL